MEEATLHKDGSSALLDIALEKEGEKRKKSSYNTGYSYLVTHLNTILTEQGLTLLSRLNILLSLWYSDSPKMAGTGGKGCDICIVSYINSSFLAQFRFPVREYMRRCNAVENIHIHKVIAPWDRLQQQLYWPLPLAEIKLTWNKN